MTSGAMGGADIRTGKSQRRFSKTVAVLNMIAAWAVIAISIFLGVHDSVIGPMVGLIGFIFAAYSGIGHMDYRTFADAHRSKLEEGNR